jgi:hypothetical protein
MAWRIVVILLALVRAAPAVAQAVLRLQVDNDAMVVGPRHDRDYTHGLDASVGSRRCEAGSCRMWRLGLVQQLYTPSLSRPVDPPADRPFAGYVGLKGTLERRAPRSLWSLGATLGLRGPAALGEPLQRFIHGMFSFTEPPSWDRQLPTAPWVALTAQGGRWLQAGALRLGALGQAEVGTMRTMAAAGLRMSVGEDARWLDPRPVRHFRMGVGFEVGERWFAEDATLHGIDGGEAVAGPRAWRSWVGGDVTLRGGTVAFTLGMSWLGKDFDGQGTRPVVGSASLEWSHP